MPKAASWRPGGQINWSHRLELSTASSGFFCLSSMLGIVLHVLSDFKADGCCLRSLRNSDRSRHYRHSSLATLPVLGRRGCLGSITWGLRSHASLVGSSGCCSGRQLCRAVEFFLRKKLSALDDQPGSNMSGKCTKPVGLVEDIHEACRVDFHPSLVGDMRDIFVSTPVDRAVFESVPSTIPQPKSAWCVLFGGVWRKPLEILRGEGKAYVMGLRHACRSTGSLGKRLLFLLDNMAWY